MLSVSDHHRRTEILYGHDRYRCQGCGHLTDALYLIVSPSGAPACRCRQCKDRRSEVIRQRLPLIKGGVQCLR